MKKIIILSTIVLTFCIPIKVTSQVKIMKSGRVAIGSNNIDSVYKAEINGSNYCALSLVNNHNHDYQWSMISSVNRALTKCYIVGYDTSHTFFVLGKGQIYCKDGLIADNVIKANNGMDVLGNVNISADLFVGKSFTSNGVIKSTKAIKGPNVFTRVANWFLSDSSKKMDILPISEALDKLTQLSGYNYKLKPDSTIIQSDSSLNNRYIGFIAQDLINILPEVVCYNNDDSSYYVNYGHITALIVEGIKELKNTNDSLSSLIANLNTLISNHEVQIQTISNSLSDLQNRLDICCPPTPFSSPNADKILIKKDLLDFSINPNPFTNSTIVTIMGMTENEDVKLVISDLSGKTISKIKIENLNEVIEIKGEFLQEGMYYFTLLNNNRIITSKKIFHEK